MTLSGTLECLLVALFYRSLRCSTTTAIGGTPDLKIDGEDQRDGWVSVALGNAIIFRPDKVLAVNSLKPANCEMAPRHVLKMFNKRIVHGGTA